MSIIQDTFTGASRGAGEPSVVIRRASTAEQRLALGVLLVGMPRPADPAVDSFIEFTQKQRMSLDELWLALEHGQPIASALLAPSAGRTAILFLSPTITGDGAVEARLAHEAARAQSGKVTLVQAILDPGQEAEAGALRAAGFRNLAHLIYMQRATEKRAAALNLDAGYDMMNWSEAHRGLFALAIQKSYEQTLDCPGLLGLRQMSDIIAGHMSSGQFVPELWSVVRHGGEPAAVMLINPAPPRRGAELVYLGVSPAERGRGLARRLVEYGLARVQQHGAASLSLAVDDQNTPALRLYRSLKFHAYARKRAMIFPLP
jgi:ribosomal protein S18 acetylase RimI-like enzyme